MEKTIYATPESNLAVDSETLAAMFGTLNIWRKIYLVLMWVGSIIIIGILALALTQDIVVIAITAGLSISLLGTTAWTHWAVVKRRVDHITVLAIVNLLAGGNIIGCLIMFSIRRVSVKERKLYKIENA